METFFAFNISMDVVLIPESLQDLVKTQPASKPYWEKLFHIKNRHHSSVIVFAVFLYFNRVTRNSLLC